MGWDCKRFIMCDEENNSCEHGVLTFKRKRIPY